MRCIRATMVALAALSIPAVLPNPAAAQGISIGPGGVRIDDGRDYRDGRRQARVCRELRYACRHKEELGEEGMGNCRRYHRMCE